MATDHNTQVLTGWKAIAGYIRRDERTAMRWAAYRGLPVRRVPGGKRGPVYAIPEEIASWLSRATPEAGDPAPGDDPAGGRSAIPLSRDDGEAPGKVEDAPATAESPGEMPDAAHVAAPRRSGMLAAAMLAAAAAGALATAAVMNISSPGAASATAACDGTPAGSR